MGLRDLGASLPPGFRFYPNDEELVLHYLYRKIKSEQALKDTLVEIDLHTCEPWQLPEVAKLNANEWYFFSFRDRKYATGFRTNRATTCGYWKATGKDRTVMDPMTGEVVGMRKTLVFYRNRAPNGIKSGWIMHEFRLETPHLPPKEDWVLCRVFHKGKSDINSANKLSPQLMFDATPPSSPPTNYQITMPVIGCNNQLAPFPPSMATTTTQNNNNNSFLNLLQFSLETNTNCSSITQISTPKCGDDDGYGFLWDMELDSFQDGTTVTSNLDGIRFEVGNNNNSMVL